MSYKKNISKKPNPAGKTGPKPIPSKSNHTIKPGSFEPTGWWKWALLVLAITAACHLPSVNNELVNWDDPVNISENPNLSHVNTQSLIHIFDIEKGSVIGGYNPLTIFTFALEKIVSGEINTKLIHFDNILFHLLTVFFVLRLLLHLGIGIGGSVIGALLFGIHPMRVESVAWATERKDVLFAMFFFAALLYYVRWIKTNDVRKKTVFYIIMIVLGILSCLSKVQAVTLPLSMLVIDYWFQRPTKLKLIWEKIPFWIISLVFGLINIYTLQQQAGVNEVNEYFGIIDRLCIGAFSFCVYLYKLFIPYPMSPLYPYFQTVPVWVYLSLILFISYWVAFYLLWKRNQRMWVFGMLFFFLNVMFVLQVFGAGQGFLADRFTYVAYFGFFALAGWGYEQYIANHKTSQLMVNIGFSLIFIVFGIITVKQTGIWKNSYTLWTHVIKYEKKTNYTPYWNRGRFLREQGKYDLALADYEQAVAINPDMPQLLTSRGKTYFDMATGGKYQVNSQTYINNAIRDFTAALSKPDILDKTKAEALINRGSAYASQGNYDSALQDLNEGLKMDSKNKNGYMNRALVQYNLKQYEKAIDDYSVVLQLDPYMDNIWYERGMLERVTGKSENAIADLTRSLELNPGFGLAYLERARAYGQSGNKSNAQQDYQKASQHGIQMQEYDQYLMTK